VFRARSVDCSEPAKTVGTAGLGSRQPLLPIEDDPEPLPGSLEVLLALVVEMNQEAKDKGGRGLEGTVVGEGSSGHDEQVEEETECGETDRDASNSSVDEGVVGERVTEEEGGLKHQRRVFHDEVEVPGDNSFHPALPMAAANDNGSTHPDLNVPIEPLLSQHGEERSEEGSGQAGVEDGLDVDDSGIGAGPLRDGGVFTSGDAP